VFRGPVTVMCLVETRPALIIYWIWESVDDPNPEKNQHQQGKQAGTRPWGLVPLQQGDCCHF
jgi:hypothetical protein